MHRPNVQSYQFFLLFIEVGGRQVYRNRAGHWQGTKPEALKYASLSLATRKARAFGPSARVEAIQMV